MNSLRGFRLTLTGALLLAPVAFAQTYPSDNEIEPLKAYDGNRDQFTLHIPDGWFVVDQTPYRETGVVAFYSQALTMRLDEDPAVREEQTRQMMALADDLMSGAAPAFFIDRYKAGSGMVCSGFSDKAQKTKLKIIGNSRALGKGAKVVGQAEVAKVDFAGCKGLRVSMRVRVPADEDKQILVYTAASDDITYDFVLLTNAKYFEQNLPWFERVITTAKLTTTQ